MAQGYAHQPTDPYSAQAGYGHARHKYGRIGNIAFDPGKEGNPNAAHSRVEAGLDSPDKIRFGKELAQHDIPVTP